jgi:rfaE bifunctional protein kinase chain/domain
MHSDTNKKQSRWQRIVRAFQGKTIGVFGDFMLDEVLRGEATRISPEAPVPVVLLEEPDSREGYPGGAGNVAANIAALDGRPIPWGVIGSDESGQRLLRLLAERGIRCNTLVSEAGRVTPRKVRIVARQHQLLRLDFEKVSPASPQSSARLVNSFKRWVTRLDALIISDYQKGSMTEVLCDRLLAMTRESRVPLFVDPKPSHPEICQGATVATPNLHEAEQMAGFPMRNARQLREGGRKLLKEFGCDYLLVTRSSEGMTLFDAEGGVYSIPSVPRPVYDVTGAGDTVIATLALAYCAGASMKEAAMLANLAAGKVVLKFGTSQLVRAELLKAIAEAGISGR